MSRIYRPTNGQKSTKLNVYLLGSHGACIAINIINRRNKHIKPENFDLFSSIPQQKHIKRVKQ